MLISQPVTSCLINHSELCMSRLLNNQSRRISIYRLQRRPSLGFESSVSSTLMTWWPCVHDIQCCTHATYWLTDCVSISLKRNQQHDTDIRRQRRAPVRHKMPVNARWVTVNTQLYKGISGYATWLTADGAIRIALRQLLQAWKLRHYDVIDDVITR